MFESTQECINAARTFRFNVEHDKALFWACRALMYIDESDPLYWEALDEQSLAQYYRGRPWEARALMSKLVPIVPAAQYARICENISWAQKVCDGRVRL